MYHSPGSKLCLSQAKSFHIATHVGESFSLGTEVTDGLSKFT